MTALRDKPRPSGRGGRQHDPNHPYVRKLAWKALHMGANAKIQGPERSDGPTGMEG